MHEIATACVAALCHLLADPVPGVGIALPVLVPALAAAIVAMLLSREHAAPLAFVAETRAWYDGPIALSGAIGSGGLTGAGLFHGQAERHRAEADISFRAVVT